MFANNPFVQISVLEDPEEEVSKMSDLNIVKPEEITQEADVVLVGITPVDIRDSAHRSNDTRSTMGNLLARAILKILFGCLVFFCFLGRIIWVTTCHLCSECKHEDEEYSEQDESWMPLLDTLERTVVQQTCPPLIEREEIAPQYDIFLSFRGEDSRKTIAAQLYKDLTQEGFAVFKDDKTMDWGKIIKSELHKAILNSRTSVVILSENFANSTACLFELQTMLEQSKKSNHFIFPVFYEIQPKKLEEQAKSLNFEIKEEEVSIEELTLWRAALKEVATMSGVVSQQHRSDPELIEVIIRKLNRKLMPKRNW